MLGARKFKQHSNFPFYPWSPSYADVGRLADVFGLRGSLKTLVVCRDRKKSREALLRKVSNEGLHWESIRFLFVIYSSVICSLTRNDICNLYFPWISFWCQNLIFMKLAARISRDFFTGLISSFTVSYMLMWIMRFRLSCSNMAAE